MSENLFDYRPIKSWTGDIIDFGTGSSSVNYDITAICTDANDVSDAIFRVDAYSAYDVNTAKYINETILKFFRGEIDESYISEGIIEIETHIIESFLDVIMSFTLDSIYEIDIKGILSTPGSLADYGIFNKHIEEPRSMSLSVGTINNAADTLTHGMPYITLAWSGGALDPRCEDPAYTAQASCETSIKTSAHCRNAQGWEILTLPQNNGTQVVAYDTESECLNLDGGDVEQTGYGKCFYTQDLSSWTYYSPANKLEQCESIATNYNFYKFVWWEGPDYYDCFSCLEYVYFPSIDSVGLDRTANTAPYSTRSQCVHATNLVQAHEAWAGTIGTGGGEWEKQYFATIPGGPTGQTLCESQNCHWIIDEPRNTWVPETYNSWWPSTYTSTIMFTSQTIYEGEGIYFLPKIFELASSTASSLTMNYDTFDIRGQSKIGRQSRVFYIGYGIDINTIAYQTKINPDNYLHANLPAHLEVDDNNSKVGLIYGYTNYNDRTRIEWKRPQYWQTNPAHGIPDRYRIYRSNYYYYGITSPTEYTMGIKRLVGEVPVTDVDGYQYFEESEHSLRAEGILPYQYCYYFITAVYDDWGNTNRGLDKITYDKYFDDDFNFPPGNVLATETDVLEINFPQQNDNQEEWTDEYFGYFKPQETGDYEFSMTSDDSSWMWIGTDGQTYEDLKLTRDDQNALIDLNGVHPSETDIGTISLIAGQYYPILIYFGNEQFNQDENWEHRVSFKPPGGEFQTAGVGYWYKSNDNSFGGNGQEVEGRFTTNQLRSYFL